MIGSGMDAPPCREPSLWGKVGSLHCPAPWNTLASPTWKYGAVVRPNKGDTRIFPFQESHNETIWQHWTMIMIKITIEIMNVEYFWITLLNAVQIKVSSAVTHDFNQLCPADLDPFLALPLWFLAFPCPAPWKKRPYLDYWIGFQNIKVWIFEGPNFRLLINIARGTTDPRVEFCLPK